MLTSMRGTHGVSAEVRRTVNGREACDLVTVGKWIPKASANANARGVHILR